MRTLYCVKSAETKLFIEEHNFAIEEEYFDTRYILINCVTHTKILT